MHLVCGILLALAATFIINHAAPTENVTTSSSSSTLAREKRKIKLPWTILGLSLFNSNNDEDGEDGYDYQYMYDEELERRVDKVIKDYKNEQRKKFFDLIFDRNSSQPSEKSSECETRVKRNTIVTTKKLIKPSLMFLYMKLKDKILNTWNMYMGSGNNTDTQNKKVTRKKTSERNGEVIQNAVIMQNENVYRKKAVAQISRLKRSPLRKFFKIGKRTRKYGKKPVRFMKKAAVFTGIWTIGGVASTYASLKIRRMEADQEKQENLLKRDCQKDRYGCVNEFCWTNCGPRLNAQDFCLTTYNVPKNKSEDAQPIKCKNDHDCSNCLPCGSSCFMTENAIAAVDDLDEDVD